MVYFCQAYNPWLIDHDWRDGSDVAKVNMLKSLSDGLHQPIDSPSIQFGTFCCNFRNKLLIDVDCFVHDSMQPPSWKDSLSALISQAGCRLDVDLQCGQTRGSPSHWWHHGLIQNHAQLIPTRPRRNTDEYSDLRAVRAPFLNATSTDIESLCMTC